MGARIAPYNLDAEQAVLGCAPLERRDAMPRLARLSSEDFYTEAHRDVFRAMRRLYEAGGDLDLLTVTEELRRADQLVFVGGPAALELLLEQASIAAYLSSYAAIVKKMAALRELIQAATQIITQAFDAKDDVQAIITNATDTLARIGAEADLEGDGRAADEPIGDVLKRVVATVDRAEGPTISTPHNRLNEILGGGWRPGELVYVGASPGGGKTAFALGLAGYAAQKDQHVAIVSAEMSNDALVERMLANRARVPADRFRAATVQPEDFSKFLRIASQIAGLPITLNDQATTLGGVQRVVRRHRPALVVIDYMQLMRGPKGADRRLELDAVSQGLKLMAKRYRCVVLALSQITLVPNGKGGFHRPTMHSLKESRGLTADADTVLLLWYPDPERPNDLELIVDKGRNHPTGIVDLVFDRPHMTFQETGA